MITHLMAVCGALLLLQPRWLPAQPCQESYNKQGYFLGCSLEAGDRALNSIWVSQVFNVYGSLYGMDITQGVSWFVIDKKGKYHGQSLVRHQDRDCLMHDATGWMGQLYSVGKNQYLAWNDGVEDGFYLVQMAADGLAAFSILMVQREMRNVSERNQFFRVPKSYNPKLLLKAAEPFLCR
jgi:hypothetical protein